MSQTYLSRHAELVSASITVSNFVASSLGWTLKQVQGDEKAISLERSVG